MSDEARTKWNRAYDEQEVGSREPARVLLEYAHVLPKSGTALELAAGLAGNAIFLAERGLQTQAWDISDRVADKVNDYACARDLPLVSRACDLLHTRMPTNKFDVIVVVHYLERELSSAIVDALKEGGLLFYQTFTQRVTPEYSGPSNRNFRLSRNELLGLFSSLKVIAYREDDLLGNLAAGFRNEAYLVAQKII